MFTDGAVPNIANPKIAIFYFAFLPQFVGTEAIRPELSILTLGLAFAALTFALKAMVAVFAGALSTWLRGRPSVLRWIYRCSGIVIIGLGVKLAFEKRPV